MQYSLDSTFRVPHDFAVLLHLGTSFKWGSIIVAFLLNMLSCMCGPWGNSSKTVVAERGLVRNEGSVPAFGRGVIYTYMYQSLLSPLQPSCRLNCWQFVTRDSFLVVWAVRGKEARA